jgi:hypothetical protein
MEVSLIFSMTSEARLNLVRHLFPCSREMCLALSRIEGIHVLAVLPLLSATSMQLFQALYPCSLLMLLLAGAAVCATGSALFYSHHPMPDYSPDSLSSPAIGGAFLWTP